MQHRLRPADRMDTFPPYFFHGLSQKVAQLRASGVDVIRMDMGSPDLPPAPFVVEALKRSADEPSNHGYMPFGGTPEYRHAWATFYARRFGVKLDAEREVTGLLGSKEGVFHLAMAWVNPGDVVLVPDPGYAPYAAGARFAGGTVVPMPLLAEHAFLPDLHSIPDATLRRTKILWLNYPNNPTGAVAPRSFFADVVALARTHGFLVAHDAPYMEIAFNGYRPPSLLEIPGATDVCIEFNSMSKTYNMGGWRLGVACGNTVAIRALATLKSNVDTGSFRPLLDAAIVALTADQTWVTERNEQYRQRRDVVVQALHGAGFEVHPAVAAMYVWSRLPGTVNDQAYAAALLDTVGVSVTPGTVFGPNGSGYIRWSLGTPLARVHEAMERVKYFHSR